MNISVIDGSNYFKGLLLLIRKDGKIAKEEHSMLSSIGKNLGFDEDFVENAIDEILKNRYISTNPPVFSSREIAEKFLKDGLIIAASDNEIHPQEEKWLCSIASKNSIEKSWVEDKKTCMLLQKKSSRKLEVDRLKVIF